MHILDGHLPVLSLGVGFAVSGGLLAATLPSLDRVSPPRVATVSSAFFVASLLRLPFAGTSLHLSLVGLTGVVLGRAAFPAVVVGLVLQWLMFGHGGLTTLGVNAATMGIGALVAALAFHGRLPGGPRETPRVPRHPVARGALAGFLGTACSLSLYAAALLTAGEGLRSVAWACVVVHAPVLVIETVLGASVVGFLLRARPELLAGAPRRFGQGDPPPLQEDAAAAAAPQESGA